MKTLIPLSVLFVIAAATNRENVQSISEKFLKFPTKYPVHAAAANISGPSLRIVGGDVVDPMFFYYQAALFIPTSSGQYFCGGSLIHREWVVTSAACVDDVTGTIEVVLGAHNILIIEEEQQIRYVGKENVFIHPEWDSVNAKNDLALILFDEDVEYTERILPIVAPSRFQEDIILTGENATISGWGRTSDGSTAITDVLRMVTAVIISNEECRSWYGDVITETHVCASGDGGKGPCAGDNGGPLRALFRLMGVVSFGSSNCESGAPHVYTFLTKYIDWMQTVTGYWSEY